MNEFECTEVEAMDEAAIKADAKRLVEEIEFFSRMHEARIQYQVREVFPQFFPGQYGYLNGK